MFDKLVYTICVPLGALMKLCWQWLGNYGLAIILFTVLSKLVILPVSVWVHKNSIKMVKIQPDINFLKAKYYGDMDTVAAEQSKLFKREKYSPLASVVSLLVQLFLLSSIITIIYHPLSYLLGLSAETVTALAGSLGIATGESGTEIMIVQALQGGAVPGEAFASILPDILGLDFSFLGFDITRVASKTAGIYLLVPLLAGASAYVMCWAQNALNVLQHEQSKISQWGMMIFSVALSLYLGFFVPAGIALYWICSNLFSVVQQLALNAAINPQKYVDYAALEKSREALASIEALDAKNDPNRAENKRREKTDYKKFFGVVNKHVVIYSERSGFYKYFEGIISELLRRSNLVVHYVTSDPEDAIFKRAEAEPRIRPYYIGNKKLITLMMRMDADIVIMTTPDLDKYYIKRSLVRKDIEYIYVPHDPMSMHMSFQEGALDHFDTIFCTGPHIAKEVRETERVYGLPAKKLVEFGYPLMEKLIAAHDGEEIPERVKKQVLIAPSWQEDNLCDSCLDTLIGALGKGDYKLIVRPHPEYVKRYPDRMQAILDKYASQAGEDLVFETDFSSNSSVYSSDLMITDWSGVACEFCYATKKPVLFVNTAMKVENPNWQKIDCVPVEIALRDKVGVAVDKEQLAGVKTTVDYLLGHPEEYEEKIKKALSEHFYPLGASAQRGASYILQSLKERQQQQQQKKKEN